MSISNSKLYLPASVFVRNSNIELGKSLENKQKIYLDQRWWIYCRQTVFGEECSDERKDICRQIQSVVREGKAVCPVAEPILSELFKIPTPSTRQNMAAVIDELSMGHSMQSRSTLDRIELLHLLTRLLNIKTDGHSIHHLAWTQAAWVLGLQLPVAKTGSLAETEALKIAYFEKRRSISMVDLVGEWDQIAAEVARIVDDSGIINSANLDIELYGTNRPGFQELFENQCAIALTKLKPALINDVAAYLWRRMRSENAGELPAAYRDTTADFFIDILAKRYSEAGTAFELPSVQIPSAIIAAKVSSGHKFNRGDYWDIQHARFALPYCTHFFTERSLASLVLGKPGNASNLYQCKVMSSDEAIAKELKTVASLP